MSEWKASIKAIDLAFELGCSLHDNDWTIFKPINHSRRRRQLRFATTVDLYVGPEDTVEFGKWPHALEVPYHRASIFHHDWEVDYTSFMAHHDAGLPPVQERVPEPQIIDQGAIAVQEGEEMVHVNVEVTEDEALSEDSWSADIQTRSSWRTTLIFALRRQATTLRLDWRNYDLVHDSIAHELHLFPADIYHVHRVRHPPDDLFQAYVEPVVVQRATDIAAGSMERIVLVDVEFHSSNIASVPEVVRQARVFVTGTTRFQLLHWLGLQPFCQHLQNRCLVWKNNELIAQGHQQLHLVHGDFLRIAVPPPGDRFDHISTRCIATAFYRGLLPQDVLDRHTMYLLGWYDYVIDPPWLSREFRMQAGEEQSFLQLDTHRTPALQDYPNCLRGDFKSTLGQDLLTCPFDRLDEELPDYASLNRADLELLQEFPADPQEGLLAQPATIQELYQLWTHQLAQQPTDETLSLVVHTWFLDFERFTTCTQPREVELSWDFTRWAQQIFEVWDDSIDAAWPISLYLVRPQPPATSRRSRGALHLIVVQRSLHDQVANLFTIVDPRLPEGVQDIATFAPIRLSKDDVIVAINYIDSCYPERSHLQCMTWHGDFELRGRVALRNWHGLSIVLIYQELPGPSTAVPAQVWEQSEDEEVGLLQKSVNRKNKFTIELDHLIPAKAAVHIMAASGPGTMPSPLEVDMPGDCDQVQQELRHWGFVCQVFSCEPHNLFLCINTHEEPMDLNHYLFCHDDLHDQDGCFLHSAQSELQQGELMAFLCSLGYARAVILDVIWLCPNWFKVNFHHSEPQLAPLHHPVRTRTPWLGTLGHQRTQQRLIDYQERVPLQAKCSLTTAFDVKDLHTFFNSGIDMLCTDLSPIDLTPELQEQLAQWPIRPLQGIRDLDAYDRLLIFTDGSSKPSMRRMVPDHADDLGHPDTWAMVVIGEVFDHQAPTGTNLTILGWTAHPVRWDPDGSAFTGISRIGSDMAERDGLIGAAMWRLSCNHAIPTVVCTDSMLSAGQASGEIGTAQPDQSFCLMRALYQALDLALPNGDFLVHHVRAHAGELFNEIVDVAAKQEASCSFNLPRQKLDMRVWREKLLQLWTLFGQKCGLPPWQDGGFDVSAPDLPQNNNMQVLEDATPEHDGPGPDIVDFTCSFASANVLSRTLWPRR